VEQNSQKAKKYVKINFIFLIKMTYTTRLKLDDFYCRQFTSQTMSCLQVTNTNKNHQIKQQKSKPFCNLWNFYIHKTAESG